MLLLPKMYMTPRMMKNSQAIPHQAKTGKDGCETAERMLPHRAMTHPIYSINVSLG